ncbi:MAG: glycosyltransferase [Planctomycetaceae bacterium]|nr:glycosyltransferase [Planctomycetaceae bacterium]
MKILVISHLFPNQKNKNYGIFAARQIHAISKVAGDVTVIVPVVKIPGFLRRFKKWSNYESNADLCNFEGLEAHSVPYIRLTGNWFCRWAGFSVYLASKKIVLDMHKKKKFDVIYARCFFPDGDAGIRFSKLLNIPICCVGAGSDVNSYPDINRSMYNRFVKICNEADMTFACGQKVASRIDSVSDKKTKLIHGVVDTKLFSPVKEKSLLREKLKLPTDKKIALYVGTFKKAKGIYELIDAFDIIRRKNKDIILKICGYGIELDRMRKHIDDKDLNNTIEIVGEVDSNEINLWMQSSDVLILPSHTEGMPNVVMEAMSCGVPVVTTSVGGLPQAIGDCKGAILVEPREIKSLAAAVLKVFEDNNTYQEMSLMARKRAEESFDVNKNANRIKNYLEALVG